MPSLVLRSLRWLFLFVGLERERSVVDGKRVSGCPLTYCGWPACGGSTFPHHLNKLRICYGTNL
jgi:hypothetical protein